MYILLVGLIALVVLVIVFLATYTVVDPNEAHIVVRMGSGRKLYAPKLEGADESNKTRTSYFFIPMLMTREVLPLTNVKMDIPNIHLNDREVAPFVCDVITWVRIDNPIMAAERLNLEKGGDAFGSLGEDLKGIVHAVSREVAMKQEILEILRDRKTFSVSVSEAVGNILKSWGVELVNLEVNDIKDDEQKGSRVIADYESIRKVKVNTDARKQNSVRDREAVEVEQTNRQAAEIATAEAEENLRKRQIEKDKNIGISQQDQETEVARAMEVANKQKVEAHRTMDVGKAEVAKEATVVQATGQADAILVMGTKEAEVVTLKGQASANVVSVTGKAEGEAIEAKGLASAISKDKMAEAMKKFNDAATVIEKINAQVKIEEFKWNAHGKVAEKANINVVQSGKGTSILGMPLNAETGADLGTMLDAVKTAKGGSKGIGDTIKEVLGKVMSDKKE